MGAGERPPRPPASTALIRGVALIVLAVVIGVVVVGSTDTFQPVADREPTAATTTTLGAPPVDPDAPVDPTTDGTEPGDEGVAVREPTEYSVVVANGSGVGGAAARFSEQIATGGFQVATPTNADRAEVSVLYFAEGFEGEAARVAALLDPVPALQPITDPPPVEDPGDADLVLVVGPDLAAAEPAPTDAEQEPEQTEG